MIQDMYKAVVFDLDGTLVDTPLCFKSIRRELGVPDDQYILEFLSALPASAREPRLRRLEEIELEAARRATPFPGVVSLLADLKSRGLRVGILTRNCKAATNQVLSTHELAVDITITRDDAPPKPNPAGIEKLLARWRLDRPEMLFVGDFHFDIECGRRAGVRTALFTNGQAPSCSLAPDHIIPDFRVFWQSLDELRQPAG